MVTFSSKHIQIILCALLLLLLCYPADVNIRWGWELGRAQNCQSIHPPIGKQSQPRPDGIVIAWLPNYASKNCKWKTDK